MSRRDGRRCPVCSMAPAPVFRPLCPECWHRLPPQLAAAHRAAWRARIRNPSAYGESLIKIYEWRKEHGLGHPAA